MKMTGNPLVSIIIPAYNASNYLDEAIQSALRQTYAYVEIIVVNDGSEDYGATEGIALSYGSRIRYFRKENGGVASALNYGIFKMQGEYFSWLSHDDLYLPDKIEKQIQRLRECDDCTRIVFARSDFKIENRPEILSNTDMISYPAEKMENGIFPVLCNMVNGCTVLIHKSHFERTGLFDESLKTTQDYDMWLRMFLGQKSCYIPEALVLQRLHPNQGSRTIQEFQGDCEALYKKMLDILIHESRNINSEEKYSFAVNFLLLFQIKGWMELYCKCEEYLSRLRAPADAMQRRKELICKYYLDAQRVIIYCAGENGRRLLAELKARQIHVGAFTDNNCEKWNKKIDGLLCIPPDKLQKSDTIIVSKEAPGDIYKDLVNNGFMHVLTYDMLRYPLYAAPPKI